MERPLRHDRRARAREAARLGEHDRVAKNEAYNIVNGDIFRWSWLWPRIAKWFGVAWEGFEGAPVPLEGQMANDAEVWKRMATKYGLVEPDLWRVASPWHTDLDLGRPIEVMTDMALSRKLGFLVYQNTEEAFQDLFATPSRGEDHSLRSQGIAMDGGG